MDHYRLLGVAEDATPDDIKKAFRERARKFHPDVADDDPEAEAKFKDLRRAYETLMDEGARKQYDLGQHPISLEDLFRTAEGADFLSHHIPTAPATPRTGAPLIRAAPVRDGMVTISTPEETSIPAPSHHPLLLIPEHGEAGRNGAGAGDLFILPTMEP